MRSPIQANRGKARLLSGVPPEAPAPPVLNLLISSFYHFIFAVPFFYRPSS
jgi:hypothetical protein